MEIPVYLTGFEIPLPLKLLGIVNHDSSGNHAYSFVRQ